MFVVAKIDDEGIFFLQLGYEYISEKNFRQLVSRIIFTLALGVNESLFSIHNCPLEKEYSRIFS